MKQVRLKALATLLLLLMFPICMEAKRFDEIKLGMTQSEVRALVGKPKFKRMNYDSEQWEYHSLKLDGSVVYITTVDFANNHVVACNSYERPNTSIDYTPQYQVPLPYGRMPMYRNVMDDADFNVFYRYVVNETFDDNKLKLITVGSLNGGFSCRQCARMMDVFNFDDKKLKVIKIMAPRLVDRMNTTMILSKLTFESSKEEAARMLGIPWGNMR
ncbi:hypothetical protein HMPREF3034_02598 [Prevotella sp. DNF00663]|uniref:DUF4476 domain-containing protein n=1 Tax=Prevotella sp. DNF00663 TaxID=1384078 RepID=UPI000785973C|nr:DUF4476 domain-containing protein [Prevotella sp. DNF00663]KXB77918.1 hypothetical protein HMPREF3034_02598 [Prevotella sp. DNF00663]